MENTVIGEKISIEGNIRGDEHIIIEGLMKGNVEMEKHDFTVGSKGRVEGEINAQNVKISGQMIGNIKTQGKVEITKEADFMGDIRAKSISVLILRDQSNLIESLIEKLHWLQNRQPLHPLNQLMNQSPKQ